MRLMRARSTRYTQFVKQMAARLALAAATLVVGSTTAQAQSRATTLLINTNPHSLYVYDGLNFGGWAYQGTSARIISTFAGIGTTESLLDLGQMMQYDALWVDQRYQSAPLDAELSNILAFAATGKRVVIVGENATWGPWNDAILTALGGREGEGQSQDYYWTHGHVSNGCLDGLTFSAVRSPLTTGVNRACGGYAVGGTPLFDYNVATLWGAQQNVLTVLDANLFDERFMLASGVQFRENVLDWLSKPLPGGLVAAAQQGGYPTLEPDPAALASPRMLALDAVAVTATPEPTSVALVGAGLLALGAAVRRRRAR
jgi:hypothetical protein